MYLCQTTTESCLWGCAFANILYAKQKINFVFVPQTKIIALKQDCFEERTTETESQTRKLQQLSVALFCLNGLLNTHFFLEACQDTVIENWCMQYQVSILVLQHFISSFWTTGSPQCLLLLIVPEHMTLKLAPVYQFSFLVLVKCDKNSSLKYGFGIAEGLENVKSKLTLMVELPGNAHQHKDNDFTCGRDFES